MKDQTMWADLEGMDFAQRFYDVNGVQTRSIEAGSGEPLVFLHGCGGHAEAYIKNIRAHAKHFRVYCIDFIGHGYSGRPDIDYDLFDFVEHVRGFLDAIGAKQAYISGESMGSFVAAWLAIKYPERVKKVVLNTGILVPPTAEGAKEWRDLVDRTKAAATQLSREAMYKRIAWLMKDPEKSVTEELVDVRYRILQQPGIPEVMVKIVEKILGTVSDLDKAGEWLNPEKLAEIKCPALVLWTPHNPGQDLEIAKKGLEVLQNGRLVVLENSGHWPQWEEVEEFDRLHLEFLTEA